MGPEIGKLLYTVKLTFRGPCIVIYLITQANKTNYFSMLLW